MNLFVKNICIQYKSTKSLILHVVNCEFWHHNTTLSIKFTDISFNPKAQHNT